MSERLPAILGAILFGALLVGGVLWWNKGARMELHGEVLKVRTYAVDDASSIAILDFRFVNPSDYRFVVGEVSLLLDQKDGKTVEGAVTSEVDARRLFEAIPALGQKYNDVLLIREKLAPKVAIDKMAAARFELPESALLERRAFRVRVKEVDGAVSEIAEGRK